MRDGLDDVFLGGTREGVKRLVRDGSCRGAAGRLAACAMGGLSAVDRREGDSLLLRLATEGAKCAGVFTSVLGSAGSEEGGSEPIPGLNGVRKGDLNGLCSVLAASFSRRRLACGVDISACTETLGDVYGFQVVCVSDSRDGLQLGCGSRKETARR